MVAQRFRTTKASERQKLLILKDEGPKVQRLTEQRRGIFRVQPELVPRSFLRSADRLRLHPDDRYAFGVDRGKIAERWIGSDTQCENGPDTLPFEGISKILFEGELIPLSIILGVLGERALGKYLFEKFGGKLRFYNKLFDFMQSIMHHLHQKDGQAWVNGKLDQIGKAEGYVHLPHYNTCPRSGDAVVTWFGLEPGTTHGDLVHVFETWNTQPSRILEMSQARLLTPHRNWFVPSGLIHAPGPMLTMEIQEGSDAFGMFQSCVEGVPTPWSLLTKNFDPSKVSPTMSGHNDLDWLAREFDLNLNARNPSEFMIIPTVRRQGDRWKETWEIYGRKENGDIPFVQLKLELEPGADIVLKYPGVHNVFCVQGCGTIGTADRAVEDEIRVPGMILFGAETQDEFFVLHDAAVEGVRYRSTSSDNLVVYLSFGCNAFSDGEVPQVGLRSATLMPR